MFGSRIGWSPFGLFYQHAEAVLATVQAMQRSIAAAAQDRPTEDAVHETGEAELDADRVKTELREGLIGPIKLAIPKDTLMSLLSRQDRIADHAWDVADLIAARPLVKDQEARDLLLGHARAVVNTVVSYERTVLRLKELLDSGFAKRERDALHELIREVNLLEHEADTWERRVTKRAFTPDEDDDPLGAMHLIRVTLALDQVANSAEKSANELLTVVGR